MHINRQQIFRCVAALALALGAMGSTATARDNPGRTEVLAAIAGDRATAIERLRAWIALPTIANMGVNTPQGADSPCIRHPRV